MIRAAELTQTNNRPSADGAMKIPRYSPSSDQKIVEFTPERELRWLEYLRSLPYSGATSSFIAASAERLWRSIRPTAGSLSVPDAVATETGGIFMSWDRGDHHLEIELMSSGRYDWFYRNRKTGAYGGGEDFPIQVIAPELVSQLMLVTR
ncbi:MAG TPA: hypothetical protein VE974_24795 [Thermoanaerobaculia bacterium]|nr:hypothetical protein [Thermoanaerobaculia bacterium]